MDDWNAVVTLLPEGYRDAKRLLRRFGDIAKTSYRDVLVLRTERPVPEFLDALDAFLAEDARLANAVARLVPVTRTFEFDTVDAFRSRAAEAALPWAAELAGHSFHVRMHRRGFKNLLLSRDEEAFLGNLLLDRIHAGGGEARVAFEDPDFIIALETVDGRAGLSLWSRADLACHELLRLD